MVPNCQLDFLTIVLHYLHTSRDKYIDKYNDVVAK